MKILLTDLNKLNVTITQDVIDEYNIVSNYRYGTLSYPKHESIYDAAFKIKNVELIDNCLYGDIIVLKTLCGEFLSTVYKTDEDLKKLQLRLKAFIENNKIKDLVTWHLELPAFKMCDLYKKLKK